MALIDSRIVGTLINAFSDSNSALDFIDRIEEMLKELKKFTIVIGDEMLELEVVNEEPEVWPDTDVLLAVLRDQHGRKWTLELVGWNYTINELETMEPKKMVENEGFHVNLCNDKECYRIM